MSNKDTVSLTIRLPHDLAAKVKKAAQSETRTVNNWMTKTLEVLLKNK